MTKNYTDADQFINECTHLLMLCRYRLANALNAD